MARKQKTPIEQQNVIALKQQNVIDLDKQPASDPTEKPSPREDQPQAAQLNGKKGPIPPRAQEQSLAAQPAGPPVDPPALLDSKPSEHCKVESLSNFQTQTRLIPRLTVKQAAFVAAYHGDGIQAAKDAGYAGSRPALARIARENLAKPHIRAQVQAKLNPEFTCREISPESILAGIAAIAFAPIGGERTADRLKALELLCKNQGLLVQKVELDLGGGLAQALNEARERLAAHA